MTDLYLYNTLTASGAPTFSSYGAMMRGNKIWTIAPFTVGNVLGNPPRMQYTVRHYFKNFV
jgi:hypothetical protein